MATPPKKPGTPPSTKPIAPPAPPSTGWRSRVATASGPSQAEEMAAARQRAASWAPSNLLKKAFKGTVANIAALQQPASNLANLLTARVVGSDTSSLGEMLGAMKTPPPLTADARARLAKMEAEAVRRETGTTPVDTPRDGYDGSSPGSTVKSPVQGPPLSSAFGPRAQQIAGERIAKRKAEEARRLAAQEAADARVASENTDQAPVLERVMRNTPLAPLFDSRGGLAASSIAAGSDPSMAMALEMANPASWSPADLTGVLGARLWGKAMKGESLLPRLEGIGLKQRPFAKRVPLTRTTFTSPQLEATAARRADALKQQEFQAAWKAELAKAGEADAAFAAERAAFNAPIDTPPIPQTPDQVANARAAGGVGNLARTERGLAQNEFKSQWDTALTEERAAQEATAARAAERAASQVANARATSGVGQLANTERGLAQNEFKSQWDTALTEERAAQEATAARAESAGFAPDPAPAVSTRGWRSRVAAPVAPSSGDDFVQRGFNAGDGRVEAFPPQRQVAGQAEWNAALAEAEGQRRSAAIDQAITQTTGLAPAAPPEYIGWRRRFLSSPAPSGQPRFAPQAAPQAAPQTAPQVAPPAQQAMPAPPPQMSAPPPPPAMPPARIPESSVPPPPAAPPVAPAASAAPVEAPAVALQAMPPAAAVPTPPVEPPPPPKPVVTPVAPERSRFAPSKPVAPTPRVQEAPPVQATAPQYAPVDVPGVREPVAPVAPVAPAVGAGTAAPPGVVPPAPEMAPLPASLNARAAQLPPGVDAAAMDRVERIAARWGQMDSKEKIRVNRALSVAEKQALNELIAPGRYGDPTARAKHGAGGSQVGFLGLTPQLVEGAGREVGKAFQSLEKAAEDFAGSVARVAPSGFSPATRRVAQKAKEAVQYWTRKSMLTDNVQDAERLTDLLEGVADSSAGIARRAKDDWAPLRDLPKDVQTEVVAALRDPAKMAALVASNPEVGAMASKARGKITDLTQQVLRQQFGVEEATWAALSTQEKKILDEALRNENTLLPNRQMAVLTDLSRAKLIASGALRPVPGKKGRYEFKDQMLSTSEALDNADAYLQRKYAAFEGGRGAATPEAIIAKHPNLTDDEKTRIYELLGNSQSSAGDPRTLRERGMLLARQNISPALRAALGELTGDAGYLVPKTIQDMEKHVALSQTREAIAGNSNWVAPIDETPEAAAARWGVQPTRLSEDVTRNGLLAGRWVHPEVADVLQAQWGFHNPGAAAEAMRGLVGKWKWAKTVANPASHARQWVQNSVAFDLAAGGWIDGVRRTRDAIGEIAQQGPLYKEARDAGLLRGNFHDAELSRVMHQEALKLEPGPDGMLGHLGSFGELLHTLGGKADRAWQIADEATQVGLFGWAREQGMTAQQAVRYVRDVTYDSSSMSRLERLVSGRGAASTMTKPGTVTKALDALTLVANAPFAMSSLYGLRRGAKSLLGIGHNHWMPLTDPALAFRASKYWVLPTLAASAAGAAVMESRPDYEQPLLDNQLPKTVPLPSQVSAFLGEDGKPNFLDIGAFVPWGEAARAVYDTSKLSGEHDPQSMNPLQHAAAMATGGAMSMVRGGLNPILQTGVDIAQNRDTFSGKPVYNPSMGGREILSKSLGQATRNLLPDFTPGIPAALASGDVRDLIKEGGAGFAKLGAGAYNFAADRYSDATGQAVDHMADYRFRDQSLPRALLSTLLGVRTYDGDAEKNATFRETDRKSAVAEENKNYRRLLRQPQRTDAQRADDEKRHLQRLKNIATGGPQKWRGATPNADTLRGLLGL